jgi:hypothetical protein
MKMFMYIVLLYSQTIGQTGKPWKNYFEESTAGEKFSIPIAKARVAPHVGRQGDALLIF